MKTEHTKGPWKVLEHARGNKRTCVTTANGAPVHAVICEIDVMSVATDEATRFANARLIAAAPELLAALYELVKYDEGSSEEGTYGSEVMERCRAAIAKAEGNVGRNQLDELDKKIAESDRLFAIRQVERAARQKALRIAYLQKALRDAQAYGPAINKAEGRA